MSNYWNFCFSKNISVIKEVIKRICWFDERKVRSSTLIRSVTFLQCINWWRTEKYDFCLFVQLMFYWCFKEKCLGLFVKVYIEQWTCIIFPNELFSFYHTCYEDGKKFINKHVSVSPNQQANTCHLQNILKLHYTFLAFVIKSTVRKEKWVVDLKTYLWAGNKQGGKALNTVLITR